MPAVFAGIFHAPTALRRPVEVAGSAAVFAAEFCSLEGEFRGARKGRDFGPLLARRESKFALG